MPLATGGVVLVGGAAGPDDPLREDYLSTGPAPPPSAAGTTAASRALPRPAGFESPRGLALVASIALLLTVLHRESLWLHARLFPGFFQTGLTTPLSASYAALMPSLAPISTATVAAAVAAATAGAPAAAAPAAAAIADGTPGAGAIALVKAAPPAVPVPPPAVAVASAAAQAALNAVDSVSVATPPDASPTRRALAAKLEATGQGIKAAIAASEAAKVGDGEGRKRNATWVQSASRVHVTPFTPPPPSSALLLCSGCGRGLLPRHARHRQREARARLGQDRGSDGQAGCRRSSPARAG